MKEMECVFICSGEYPDNQAPAIRHTLFARGLAEIGWMIEIWLLTPQPWRKLTQARSNSLKFIKLNKLITGGRLWRAISKLLAIICLSSKVLQLAIKNKRGGNIAVVLYCTELVFLIPTVIISKLFCLPLIHERTEFPYVVSKRTLIGQFSLKIYLHYILPAFDCITVINDELGEFIEKFNPQTAKLLTVVDVNEFRPSVKSKYTFPYIAYCGTMYGQKDGLDILVKAFSIISHKFPELKLILVGDNSKTEELAPLIKLIKTNGLSERILFTGRVERQDVPIILRSAKALALAKPLNEQNSGNFPMKIGEYLATGVPVVVTNVGEIPRFIRDNITGYLSHPDEESFANRLDYVISNPLEAKDVGMQGSILAERLFSYKAQSTIFSEIISKVVDNK